MLQFEEKKNILSMEHDKTGFQSKIEKISIMEYDKTDLEFKLNSI